MRVSAFTARSCPLRTLQRVASRLVTTQAAYRAPGSERTRLSSVAGGSGDGRSDGAAAAGSTLCRSCSSLTERRGARVTFAMPEIKDRIELSDEEQELFAALLEATKQARALRQLELHGMAARAHAVAGGMAAFG